MEFHIQDLYRILLALLAGGLIGLEREMRDKSAGFRTLIFISMGSAAFTILSLRLAQGNDPTRIAANIVTGIGFLGAGTILHEGLRVRGLTTAATIWLAAAMGMAIGADQFSLAGILVLTGIIVLWVFPFFENLIGKTREEHTYELVLPPELEKIEIIKSKVKALGLRIQSTQRVKQGEELHCSWVISGAPKKHALLVKFLFADKDVKELRY
jgi:putative Mg2+ transporter-C (MgtC) family protein